MDGRKRRDTEPTNAWVDTSCMRACLCGVHFHPCDKRGKRENVNAVAAAQDGKRIGQWMNVLVRAQQEGTGGRVRGHHCPSCRCPATHMMVIDALGGKGKAPVRLFPPKFLEATQSGKEARRHTRTRARRQGGRQAGGQGSRQPCKQTGKQHARRIEDKLQHSVGIRLRS